MYVRLISFRCVLVCRSFFIWFRFVPAVCIVRPFFLYVYVVLSFFMYCFMYVFRCLYLFPCSIDMCVCMPLFCVFPIFTYVYGPVLLYVFRVSWCIVISIALHLCISCVYVSSFSCRYVCIYLELLNYVSSCRW